MCLNMGAAVILISPTFRDGQRQVIVPPSFQTTIARENLKNAVTVVIQFYGPHFGGGGGEEENVNDCVCECVL